MPERQLRRRGAALGGAAVGDGGAGGGQFLAGSW